MRTNLLSCGRVSRWFAAFLGTAIVSSLNISCSPPSTSTLPAQTTTREVQDLLVRGVAHAEIEEWAEAIASFETALGVSGEDPVVLFDLAVCLLRADQPARASQVLERIGADAPAELRARASYLRGKLALEVNDVEAEVQAYRQAMALDPTEVAYPFALAQLLPRLGGEATAETGPLLEVALQLWPDNARLLADLSVWRLEQPNPAAWEEAVESLAQLAADDERASALIERGRSELAAEPDRAPSSVRRALNVLRPGKRFQADWAALEARLVLLPLRRPAASAFLETWEPAAVSVSLEKADLLSTAPLEDGEHVVAMVTSADAIDAAAPPIRAFDLTLLTSRGVWVLDRGESAFHYLGDLAGGRRILAGDLDADGAMERVVLGEGGVTIFGRPAGSDWRVWSLEQELTASAVQEGILHDFELDGDLDLLMIDRQGQIRLARNRGEAGLGSPESPGLPIEQGSRLFARDLDLDDDPDLMIASGSVVFILSNHRQGEYQVTAELSVAGTVESLLTTDLDGDDSVDLTILVNGQLRFFAGREARSFEAKPDWDATAASLASGSPVVSLAAADLDLDGDLDLIIERQGHAGPRAIEVIETYRLAVIARIEGLPVGTSGLLTMDLDADHDEDLLLATPDGLETLRTSGAEDQGWVEVVLRGLASKVPLDGRGTRVDVWFGLDRQSFEMTRPELVVGLGGRTPALIEVTWPNGITELVFDPAPNRAHRVEQELRIEGSCPFLYASDGDALRFVTDVLSLAPLGMLIGNDRYAPADPEEYLRLPDWVAADRKSGDLELAITEELREVAYLDQAELVVIDAPAEIGVYNGERWIEGQVEGLDLRLLGPFEAPTSATDSTGTNVLDLVSKLDHRYLRHSGPGRRYQGAGRSRSLELSVSPSLAATGRVALLLTGWLHWGNTSTNVARSQDPMGRPVFPFLEVPHADGTWHRVDLPVGLPAGKTKPIVVDLGDTLDPQDPRLRITTDFEVYWDWIVAAESLPLATRPHHEQRLAPESATLDFQGFSRWYRPASNGPYLFDYAERRAYPWRPTATGERVISWDEHEGYYSPYGDSLAAIASLDDNLVVFGSGEQLSLRFDLDSLAPPPPGWRRTFFLHLEGWEKDGDPNVACSETVGPLPSRSALSYPCESSEEWSEANEGIPRGRWVDRQRLHRRTKALIESPSSMR
ncbi:MAG: FG-GAP-like repeat-containing protein [Thermoanaerobaculia bacterium]|nr:FG-GAP-like repeat-containing protein [Thermoanaerobaculia bacterium]